MPEEPGDSLLIKVRAIVETCARNEVLGLNELARRSGVPKATVHRLGAELLSWGVLERHDGRYRLGPRLYELGLQVPRNLKLRAAALPFMEDLFASTQESVHLGVRGDLELFRIERFLGPRGISASRAPNRSPLHCSASGKVLLAFAEEDVLARTIEAGLRPRTRFTITDPDTLRANIAAVRDSGYAVDRQEHASGCDAVAVPVFAGDALIGCLSLVAPPDRFDPRRLVPALQTASRGLGRTLAL
ncbi:IclR family transcriptional regulator [Sciscionella sediminilitoris]|uniref:IclR family transcriptional regulator n=1 Tax=Sciscionella sediminilitoris TaxID=1445613 RepID=UPI0006920D9E|nr:IclR family transcriptional regulator [Sciscionella sp. SE31]